MKSTDSAVVNITDKEGQLTKANENHLWSSLSQSEELGALLTAGGSVKTLVEPTKLEVSPVEATDQQRWRLELEGARLQAARTAIGQAAEPISAVIGRGQPVRPAVAQQILIKADISAELPTNLFLEYPFYSWTGHSRDR